MSDDNQITIEDFLTHQHPCFEFAMTNLMAMKALKQLILFEYSHRFTHSPEINEARGILIEEHMQVLEAVWQTAPMYGQWVWSETATMWVNCTHEKGKRTITVASSPSPQALVAFVYTLKGQ